MPKPMTSGAKSDGRFGRQDFVYLPAGGCLPLPGGREADMSIVGIQPLMAAMRASPPA
jgi:hypothetical protein